MPGSLRPSFALLLVATLAANARWARSGQEPPPSPAKPVGVEALKPQLGGAELPLPDATIELSANTYSTATAKEQIATPRGIHPLSGLGGRPVSAQVTNVGHVSFDTQQVQSAPAAAEFATELPPLAQPVLSLETDAGPALSREVLPFAPYFVRIDSLTLGTKLALLIDQQPFKQLECTDTTVTVRLGCLPPGRHTLQAAVFRCADDAVAYSAAEARVFGHPDLPVIVAVNEGHATVFPVPSQALVAITETTFRVRLSRVYPTAEVRAYLDGREVGKGQVQEQHWAEIDASSRIAPGKYQLTVRVVQDNISSPPSKPVPIYFVPHERRMIKKQSGSLSGKSTAAACAKEQCPASNVACDSPFAFDREPWHKEIDEAQPCGDLCERERLEPPSNCPDKCEQATIYDHRFHAVAHFPLRGHSRHGNPMENEGALIYEGMQFQVRNDGQYCVRYVVDIPKTAVDLRLQLVLEMDDGQYTLTLPRVSFAMGQSGVRQVCQEGYLPILKEAPKTLTIMGIRRRGTARFGCGVPTEDYGVASTSLDGSLAR